MPPRIRAAALPSAVVDACPQHASKPASLARSFTTTPCREKMSQGRYMMFRWLKGGEARPFAQSPSSPQYLGPLADQPFPLNPLFRSQPVLDNSMKQEICARIEKGDAIKVVSAELGVDVRRVAAVVRLNEIEQRWKSEGKSLALPYAEAVMKMLPRTFYNEGEAVTPHEPINDIPVHGHTRRQLFVPTSESRTFTREDAAKAFNEDLKSADERSQHPQLIAAERAVHEGTPRSEALEGFREAAQAEEEDLAARLQRQRRKEEASTQRYKTDRFEFRIKSVNAERGGKDGKSDRAIGARYGAPYMDRQRGAVKIPTSVP